MGHLGVVAAPDVADQARVHVGQLALVPQRVVSVHLQQRENDKDLVMDPVEGEFIYGGSL